VRGKRKKKEENKRRALLYMSEQIENTVERRERLRRVWDDEMTHHVYEKFRDTKTFFHVQNLFLTIRSASHNVSG